MHRRRRCLENAALPNRFVQSQWQTKFAPQGKQLNCFYQLLHNTERIFVGKEWGSVVGGFHRWFHGGTTCRISSMHYSRNCVTTRFCQISILECTTKHLPGGESVVDISWIGKTDAGIIEQDLLSDESYTISGQMNLPFKSRQWTVSGRKLMAMASKFDHLPNDQTKMCEYELYSPCFHVSPES